MVVVLRPDGSVADTTTEYSLSVMDASSKSRLVVSACLSPKFYLAG